MARTNLLVVFGGTSSEHEISLRSAHEVIAHIDRDRFDVSLLGQRRDGTFRGAKLTGSEAPPPLQDVLDGASLVADVVRHLQRVDVVFPLLHGPFGEDGCLQGLFELAGCAYVGAGVLASALCMNKVTFKRYIDGLAPKIDQMPWMEVRARAAGILEGDESEISHRIERELGFPCFVKPASQGSSVGVSRVSRPSELAAALAHAAQFDLELVIERGASAREIELAVLGDGGPETRVSMPGEICLPEGTWYDYDSKYISEAGVPKIPADLPPEVTQRLQAMALQAFRATGCHGLARIDFFVERQTMRPILNEINTMPGFTSISMYPQLMRHAGFDYVALIGRLIDLAITRKQARQGLRNAP